MTKYKLDIMTIINYYIGEECDIIDYFIKDDKLVILFENGDIHRKTITRKQLEKDLNVKKLIFKFYENELSHVTYNHIED